VEDPVSGNAHAMLAAYLWKSGRLGERSEFVGRQGRQMSRPGEVRVRMQIEAGELRSVRIGGHAVIVSAGTLTG
jgi:PhzF family phenazine biosynthesis protein